MRYDSTTQEQTELGGARQLVPEQDQESETGADFGTEVPCKRFGV